MTSSSEKVPEIYVLKGFVLLLSYGLHITKHLLIISYSYVFMYQYLHLYFSFGTCIAFQINSRESKGPFSLTTESPISILHRFWMLYSCGRAINYYIYYLDLHKRLHHLWKWKHFFYWNGRVVL